MAAEGEPTYPVSLPAEAEAILGLIPSRDLRSALASIVGRGVALPEVGYELADERGHVIAEAEAAWPDRRVAILDSAQAESADRFVRAGWRWFSAETLLPDTDQVLEALGLRSER